MPDPTSQTPPAGAPNGGTPPGVNLGTPPAGTPPNANGLQPGSNPPANGETKPWYEGLVKDQANLQAIQTAKWNDLDATLTSYRNLQADYSRKGNTSQAPADPKDYVFTVPKEAEANYNKEFADGFKSWAHKAGLSKEQAAALHNEFVTYAQTQVGGQMQASTQALSETVTKAQASLEKAWGGSITPEFARNLEMSKRALTNLHPDLKQELVDVGAIVKSNGQDVIAKPAIFQALAKIGGQLYAEDTLFGQASRTSNPFDPKTADHAAQNHLVSTDPARAKLLIRTLPAEAQRMWEHFLSQ